MFNTNKILVVLVECEWNEFGDWSACSATCGGGISLRERTIKTPAQYGGKDCTGEAREEKRCNTYGCPGRAQLL